MDVGNPGGEAAAANAELAARVAANEAAIEELRDRADDADVSSHESQGRSRDDRSRIGVLEDRAEKSERRAETSEQRADVDRDRIWALEGRANIDAVMIAELQAEGLVNREQVATLERALQTSRSIGAAIGVLMARHTVSEPEAFAMLRQASQDSNRKLRLIAEEVLRTGDLDPGAR